jgi:NAD(P)H-dependent FMN reductase
MHIAIISSSVRIGRKSHRVAMYFQQFILASKSATVEILDLSIFNFPVFTERLNHQPRPMPSALLFAEKISSADGIIIVTPEYNGGYPASLKNAIDLLSSEWNSKPIAICTVSDGVFGGNQALVLLQFTLWKIKALTVTSLFPVRNVEEEFDETGNAYHKDETDKRAQTFVQDLIGWVELNQLMQLNATNHNHLMEHNVKTAAANQPV